MKVCATPYATHAFNDLLAVGMITGRQEGLLQAEAARGNCGKR